jgi:hypothetical protein
VSNCAFVSIVISQMSQCCAPAILRARRDLWRRPDGCSVDDGQTAVEFTDAAALAAAQSQGAHDGDGPRGEGVCYGAETLGNKFDVRRETLCLLLVFSRVVFGTLSSFSFNTHFVST